MRERLLAAVRARLGAGELQPMLSEAAQTEVDQLLEYAVIPRDLDAEIVYTVGMFYLVRSELRSDGERMPDRLLAIVLLAPLAVSRPHDLPEALLEWIEPALQGYTRAGDTSAQIIGRSLVAVAWLILLRRQRLGEPDRHGLLAELSDQALALLPPGHATRPMALCAHGFALLSEDEAASTASSTASSTAASTSDRAVVVFREAYQQLRPGAEHYARAALGLASALGLRADRTGDESAIAEIEALSRVAADPESGGDAQLIDGARQMLAQIERARASARPDGLLAQMTETVDQADKLAAQLAELRESLHQEWPRRDRQPASLAEHLTALEAGCATIEQANAQARTANASIEERLRRTAERPRDETDWLSEQFSERLAQLLGDDSRFADLVDTHREFFQDLGYFTRSALRAVDDAVRVRMLGSERAGEVSPWLSLPGAGPRSRPERTDLDEVIALHERMLRELPADHPQHAQLRASYLALSMDRLPDRASPENKARLGS